MDPVLRPVMWIHETNTNMPFFFFCLINNKERNPYIPIYNIQYIQYSYTQGKKLFHSLLRYLIEAKKCKKDNVQSSDYVIEFMTAQKKEIRFGCKRCNKDNYKGLLAKLGHQC